MGQGQDVLPVVDYCCLLSYCSLLSPVCECESALWAGVCGGRRVCNGFACLGVPSSPPGNVLPRNWTRNTLDKSLNISAEIAGGRVIL